MARSRKTDIKKDLMASVEGAAFCSRSQIAAFLGYKDTHSIGQLLSEIPKRGEGHGARYYVGDVADRIAETMH